MRAGGVVNPHLPVAINESINHVTDGSADRWIVQTPRCNGEGGESFFSHTKKNSGTWQEKKEKAEFSHTNPGPLPQQSVSHANQIYLHYYYDSIFLSLKGTLLSFFK